MERKINPLDRAPQQHLTGRLLQDVVFEKCSCLLLVTEHWSHLDRAESSWVAEVEQHRLVSQWQAVGSCGQQ